MIVLTDTNGTKFRATKAQAEAIESLSVARAGGIATIRGYSPSTGWEVRPKYDAQLLTRFNLSNLYARKMAAISDVRFSDIAEGIAADPVLSTLSDTEAMTLFNTRKAMAVESMQKTIEGSDRSDAHRAGHDRCYARMADGIRVHFVTEKDADGIMQPVLTDGMPTVNSIMLSCLELNRTYVAQGVRKVVNSGAPKRISNLIDKTIKSKSVSFKSLSLKEGNFDSLTISRKKYLAEDVTGIDASILAD